MNNRRSPSGPRRLQFLQRGFAVSQSFIARQFGVHPSTVSRWLSGTSRPPDGALEKIVAVIAAERRGAGGAV